MSTTELTSDLGSWQFVKDRVVGKYAGGLPGETGRPARWEEGVKGKWQKPTSSFGAGCQGSDRVLLLL